MRLRPRTPTRSRRVRWIAWSVGLACLGYAVLPAGAATDKIVVDEFLLRCADARPDGAFVELVATGPGQTFDAALGVRLIGPSGSTITDLPGVFASRAGQPWPEGRHFLIATALSACLIIAKEAQPPAPVAEIAKVETVADTPLVQIAVLLDKHFGVMLEEQNEEVNAALVNIGALAAYVDRHRA